MVSQFPVLQFHVPHFQRAPLIQWHAMARQQGVRVTPVSRLQIAAGRKLQLTRKWCRRTSHLGYSVNVTDGS